MVWEGLESARTEGRGAEGERGGRLDLRGTRATSQRRTRTEHVSIHKSKSRASPC